MVDLSFNRAKCHQAEKVFYIALRNARLQLDHENSEIEAGSSYKAELQQGAITQTTKFCLKS